MRWGEENILRKNRRDAFCYGNVLERNVIFIRGLFHFLFQCTRTTNKSRPFSTVDALIYFFLFISLDIPTRASSKWTILFTFILFADIIQ